MRPSLVLVDDALDLGLRLAEEDRLVACGMISMWSMQMPRRPARVA